MNSREQPSFHDIHLWASTPRPCPNAFACGEAPEKKVTTSDSVIIQFLIHNLNNLNSTHNDHNGIWQEMIYHNMIWWNHEICPCQPNLKTAVECHWFENHILSSQPSAVAAAVPEPEMLEMAGPAAMGFECSMVISGGKNTGKWWYSGGLMGFYGMYPLVNCHRTMENGEL